MPRKIKTPHLDRYLALKNEQRTWMQVPLLEKPIDKPTMAPVIEALDRDIDQEILTCDGELSDREIDDRYADIMRAKADLELLAGHRIDLPNGGWWEGL